MMAANSMIRSVPKMVTRVGGGASATATKRAFSTECAPAQKLRCVFEEYRQQHFSRELPSRFRKEMAKAIQGGSENNGQSLVAVDNFNLLLGNIGRQDALLTERELSDLLQAAGATSRKIPVEQIMQLI